jgi:hypothetical protein
LATDPATIKPVFTAYRSNASHEDLQIAINSIKKPHNQDWTKLCLVQLALEDRKAKTLEWLLDEQGFGLPHEFVHEANCVDPATDPETFRVLEEAKFRETWPRRPPTPEEPEEEYDESKDIPGDGSEFDLDAYIETLDSRHPLY